jgi:hypothetical protein
MIKSNVIARSSVITLQDHEKRNPFILNRQLAFMEQLKMKHGDRVDEKLTHVFVSDDDIQDSISQDSIALLQELTDGEAGYHTPEMDDFTPESYDEYLTAQIFLPVGGEMAKGQVTKCHRDHNGRPIGVRHSNSMLDTCEYEVQYPDGSTQSYLANVIAENLYCQVDAEGKQYAVMEEITDHEYDGGRSETDCQWEETSDH